MSNFTYAELDEEGELRRIRVYVDELTPEQQTGLNVVPFVHEEAVFDATTHKIERWTINVRRGIATKRAIIVPKGPRDFYEDALERRVSRHAPAAESEEVLFALLNRLVDWAVRQADPAKPETIFDITPQEMLVLDQADSAFEAEPLPAGTAKLSRVRKKTEIIP